MLWPQDPYRPYRLQRRDFLLLGAGGLLGGALLGVLFFRSIRGLWLIPPVSYLVLRTGLRKKAIRGRQRMAVQLRDYLLSVTAFLRAGYALENAMTGAEREMRTMHGEGGLITAEAARMSRGIRLRETPEQLWRAFGERCGLREGEQLARIFAVAKRQGGDYMPVLRAMVRSMEASQSVRREIDTLLAGQRLEFYIMCLIPAGILFYLNMTAPELTAVLYRGSSPWLMPLIIFAYGGSVLLGDRILESAYGR